MPSVRKFVPCQMRPPTDFLTLRGEYRALIMRTLRQGSAKTMPEIAKQPEPSGICPVKASG